MGVVYALDVGGGVAVFSALRLARQGLRRAAAKRIDATCGTRLAASGSGGGALRSSWASWAPLWP